MVIPHDDEDDAVRTANASDYGLSGGVRSADQDHALDVARRVHTGTGTVSVKGAAIGFDGPFVGFNASAIGREYGAVSLPQYIEDRTITV